jgi:hypothetical protein
MTDLRKIVQAKINERRSEWDGHTAALDVAAWAELEQLVSEEMRAAVRRARDAGATWQNIADVFGVTRSSAQQRFGDGGA